MSDDLDDVDLRAWQPPPVPHNLVDSVIARMTATDEAIAVVVHRRRRRSYAIAGAACAAVAASGLALWLGLPAPAHEHVTIALGPRDIALGSTTVELDRGAMLYTDRVGDRLHAVQSGTATWHVAAHDQLEIDAGSSASINATGASLRVESHVNNTSIAMVMGGVALSAGAVALTVVAYEGHVERRDGDKVTVIAPSVGAVVTPPVAYKPLVADHGDLAITPGESAVIYSLDGHAVVEFKKSCALRVEVRPNEIDLDDYGLHPLERKASSGPLAFDLVSGLYHYVASCDEDPASTLVGTLEVREDHCREPRCAGDDRNRLLQVIMPRIADPLGAEVHIVGMHRAGVTVWVGDTQLDDSRHGSDGGMLDITLDHKPGQSIVLRAQTPLRTEFFVQHAPATGVATVAKPGVRSASCDADKESELGVDRAELGDRAAALQHFEAAYACRPDYRTAVHAFMAACTSKNTLAARTYWRKLVSDDQNKLLQVVCAPLGITRAQLDAN
jgi:hypothetical protein